MSSPIFLLNEDMWNYIFDFLDIMEMLKMRIICRKVKKLSDDYMQKGITVDSRFIKFHKNIIGMFPITKLILWRDYNIKRAYLSKNIRKLYFTFCTFGQTLLTKTNWENLNVLHFKNCSIEDDDLSTIFKRCDIRHLTILKCYCVTGESFSYLKNLKALYVDGTFSKNPSSIKYLCGVLNRSPWMRFLKLAVYDDTSLCYDEIISALRELRSLTVLKIKSIQISEALDTEFSNLKHFLESGIITVEKLHITLRYRGGDDKILLIRGKKIKSLFITARIIKSFNTPILFHCDSEVISELCLAGRIQIVCKSLYICKRICLLWTYYSNVYIETFIKECPNLEMLKLLILDLDYVEFMSIHTAIEERRKTNAKPLTLKINAEMSNELIIHEEKYDKYFYNEEWSCPHYIKGRIYDENTDNYNKKF